ncbi:hypothetical protein [Clostridium estertheticum]|uniref:hypothetical protein n=1 Tax=Clostridium estertheticum TaxID=238834 RepID=UPI001C0E05DE|nr:hypothetical protein [Clostridium estertheticum]MBU3186515.1 hypothetical protein [Clostridium estertheticum]
MKIDLSKGHYGFQLREEDLIYNLSADNVIQAKELYLQHISEMIDESIDNDLWKLSKMEIEED